MLPRKETFLFAFCFLALAHSATQVCLYGASPCTGANTYCAGLKCECITGYQGDGVTCTRYCPGDLTPPTNGAVGTCNTNKTVGSTCLQTCATGYTISAGNLTRTCQANATWTPTTAVCSPKNCGALTLPSHAFYDPPCINTTYKSWCSFSCEQPNYVLQGQRNYTCNSNGVWERVTFLPNQNGNCVSISCGDFPLPDHSVADPACTLTTKGNTCAFTCLPPYVLQGQRNYTCNYFLDWQRTDVIPPQEGSCVNSSWNGVIKGSIVGNYTNGCNIQWLPSINQYTFLMNCPIQPKIAYITFYQASNFYVSVDSKYAIYYGGVNYAGSWPLISNTVLSIWIQSFNNVYYLGQVGTLQPPQRFIFYSKDRQSCWFDSPTAPIQDFQRCDTNLTCYFRGPSPQSIGQRGQCWYAECKPEFCSNTTRTMRKGYCLNNGTNDNCVNYLPDGATGCGGYAGNAPIHPLCDPFSAFCRNISNVMTCVTSPCLNGGCNYGKACNVDLSTGEESCVGNGIPKLQDSAVVDMLSEVLFALPPGRQISTQAFTNKRAMLEFLSSPEFLYQPQPNYLEPTNMTETGFKESLMMMPRLRERNIRSNTLFVPTPCSSPTSCPSGQSCVSPYCQSPAGNPCLKPC